MMNRREFLAAVGACAVARAAELPEATAARLPRWRGFNLTEKVYGHVNKPFAEADFALLAEWGFDFARLPLSYRCWATPENWRDMREPVLKEIDQAVEFGRKHRIHVCLNLHRAPGYCVNAPAEPFDLWKDETPLEATAFYWGHFAERYKGVPNAQLSFNLLNEPGGVAEAVYVRIARRLVDAIRSRDPDRLVIADGLDLGRLPVRGLVPLKIAQSTRGYDPMPLTHYKANWVKGAEPWPEPAWPLKDHKGVLWDKDRLRRERIEPWKELERQGVGVHVGEFGCHNFTPHAVVLAWMRDMLELWKEAGWGWALWNLRTNFGVLDSGRKDVNYEEFRGRKLDRAMLELLRNN